MTRVSEFNAEHDSQMAPEHRLLDLVCEVGEFAKELSNASEYGDRAVELTPEFEEEFGDALYALLSLANECGIDPDATLEASLEEYRERLESGESVGSGG
jgi:NTP pyrophosphatase (non-canonical NTP hydrolase)